jgi:hypothetical protein
VQWVLVQFIFPEAEKAIDLLQIKFVEQLRWSFVSLNQFARGAIEKSAVVFK